MPDDTPTGAPTDQAPETATPPAADMAAEAAKWKDLARKHEDRAKANLAAAKELESLKASMMSDQEKAIEAAVAAAKAETRTGLAGRLVAAEFRAAAAGRIDTDALLAGLDASKFLADDGEPDTVRITEWIDRLAPRSDTPPKPAPPKDLGQGARQTPAAAAPIRDRAALKTMTPEQIEQARKDGRLDELMGVTPK